MDTIGYVWDLVSDYVVWSASFATAALALSVYFMLKTKEPIWSLKQVPNLLILLSIVGGGYLAFASGSEVAELHAKTSNIEELRRIEERYGRWAQLPASGYSLDRTDLYVYSIMKPAFPNIREGQISPLKVDCTETGVAALKKTIDRYPDFPFSYVYLAGCYGGNGNPEWEKLAQEGLEKLENTTKVVGHHRHHDRMLELVKEWLHTDTRQSG